MKPLFLNIKAYVFNNHPPMFDAERPPFLEVSGYCSDPYLSWSNPIFDSKTSLFSGRWDETPQKKSTSSFQSSFQAGSSFSMKPKASGAEALGTEYLYLVHPENLDNVDMFYPFFVLKKTNSKENWINSDMFWWFWPNVREKTYQGGWF